KRGSFTRGYSNQSSSDSKPISTPARLPCRVITISSVSARRRTFERSFFTSERGTIFIALPCLSEPCIRIRFRNDAEDSGHRILNAVEDPQVIPSKPISWKGESPESLDAALADLGPLVPQMDLDRGAHLLVRMRSGDVSRSQVPGVLSSRTPFWLDDRQTLARK